MPSFISGGTILAPSGRIEGGHLVVEGGRIATVQAGPVQTPPGSEVIDASGLFVCPGFIDTHTHGLNGHDAMEGSQAVRGMSAEQARHGVTGFLPTLVAAPPDRLRALVAEVAGTDASGAAVLGLHLEGPFLDARMPGMFDPAAFRRFDSAELGDLVRESGGSIKVMTVACHGERAPVAAALLDAGVAPSLGHAAGTYADALKAIESGVRRCTHCFNAMTGFHHREPGIVGAMLERGEVVAELIFDGHHVHPAAARVLLALKGPEGVALVTDSTLLAGYPEGVYEWARYTITVSGGTARVPAGNLAGSLLTMDAAVRNAVELLGVTIESAVEMASLSPAKSAGLQVSKGSLAAGKDADIVFLDPGLRPVLTMVGGRVVWRS